MTQSDLRLVSSKQQKQCDADSDDGSDSELQHVKMPTTPCTVRALKHAEIIHSPHLGLYCNRNRALCTLNGENYLKTKGTR